MTDTIAPRTSPEMSSSASLRLDKWLWFARVTRTRSIAAKWCAGGQVSVGGSPVAKPHHPVRVGDVVSVTNGRWRRQLTVRSLGVRRGPAPEARQLYDEPVPAAPVQDGEPDGWEPLLDDVAADQAG